MTIKKIEPNPNNIHVAIGEINRLANANSVYRDEIKTLKKRIAVLQKYQQMVVYMGCIMDESEGVAGYHLNGDVAEWDSLFIESLYKDALAKYGLQMQAKGIEDARQYAVNNYPNGAIHSMTEYVEQLRNQARGK